VRLSNNPEENSVTQPLDAANAEAQKLYGLSKSPDHNAFQHEMDTLKQNPALYRVTMNAIEAQEQARERNAFNAKDSMSPGSKIHELKIVRDPNTHAVKEIDSKEVPVEKIGQEGNLPKVTLYQSHDGEAPGARVGARTGAGTDAGKPAENTEAAQKLAAAREQAARDTAAREAQQRAQTEATNLLTKLQNHDGPGFAKEYNSLNAGDRATVGRAMQAQLQQTRDQTTRIAQNPDGSIQAVQKNGKLEYVTPGAFINAAIDKKDAGALNNYYKSLSPEGKKEFAASLQAEATKHNVSVELDDEGNLKQIKDASGKKIYPEGKLGSILHRAESVQIQVRH
jgi:hypothetical protein